jgi:hypothetical protein
MLPIIKKSGKILIWIIGSVFLLIIALIIFIQTDVFNKYALEYTLDELNTSQSEKKNTINAESLNGNILTGITLNKGNVKVLEDTLLTFNSLEVSYDLWGLLDKRILLHSVILDAPVIYSSRITSGDSLIWNFENLFSSTTEPDTSTSPFDWDVAVEDLKITNGFVRVAADTSEKINRWREQRSFMDQFDFGKTDVSELNLDMSAKYYKDFKSLHIANLSFNTNSSFDIYKLQLDVNLNEKDTITELWNFKTVTPRSEINIYRLYAEKFNPFNDFIYEDLGHKNIDISLDIKNFNFDDLKFFLPDLSFLDSIVGLKLDASGKYGDLNVHDLVVRLPNSQVNIKGNIKNLQQPDSMKFDITGNGIIVDTRDLKAVYKELPDLTYLGIVNADLKYKGTFTLFASEFAVNTAAGYADGNLNLDLDKEIYSGYINTRNFNPGKITGSRDLNGSVNIAAKFDGSGFELNRMNANLEYSMTGSKLGRYDVRSSMGTIRAASGNMTINIRHNSSMGNASINGMVNISNMNNPRYNLKGNVQRLDVSRITGSPDSRSNLNFTFNVNGRGISPENINGVYKINMGESNYGSYQIPQTPIDAEIVNSSAGGKIKVTTDMVDVNAEGSFKIDRIIDAIMFNITQAQNIIVQSLSTDSLGGVSPVVNSLNGGDFTFNYSIVTKDSTKLQRVLKPFGVSFNGNVNGNISSSGDKFTSVSKLDVKNFSYEDTSIVLKNVKTDLSFGNLYSAGYNGINIDLNTTGDRIIFGANSFDSVKAIYKMNGPNADLYVKAGMDTTANAIINGKLAFAPGNISADLDSVHANYGGYEVENSGNWLFSVQNADRINFEQFKVKSRTAILDVNGYLALSDESDLKIEGNNIKMQDLAAIINQADTSYILSPDNDIEGEFTKLLVTYKGTFEVPVLSAEVNTNTLKYKDTDIGVLTTKANYENNVAKINLKMQNAENKGDLVLTGTIPFSNPLSGDSTQVLEISSQPVDINLKANNFLLDYFSVLVSDIASLRGVLNADLSAKGTASDPALSGNLKITKGGYLLPLTGMDYSFEAAMSTDNFKLVLDYLKLYNEDDDSRHIDLTGTLDFKDLNITDINLQATGDMVLLDKDVEQNDLGVYGYILAGIGNPPIKVQGSLDSLTVTGQLLVKDATISSIPMEGNGYNVDEDNFVYIDAGNDSVKVLRDSLIVLEAEQYYNINPFNRSQYVVFADSSKQTSLNLDLNVKTENNIYASIDFNNLTRDRLFGELKADLDIKTVDGQLQAFGSVDVAGDSYYRFYRDFKLNESSVKFDGDITNPELDIKGVYSSEKTNEQYGSVTTSEVEVVITVKGKVSKPELTLGLNQDGSQVSGSDAQSDAITYLLFGRFKNELSATERSAVASSLGASVGSLYASSYLSQTVRDILPFIVDAQFNYTEGNVQNTDVELISELGDARVKFGGKLLKEVKNFELVVDYPLNKLLNLNLPETLLLEFSREEKKQVLTTSQNDILSTEVKILYKIKF